MNEVNKGLNISGEWAKAQAALKAAEILIREDLPDQAVSRLYYVAFHAAKALLLTQGLESKTHQGVSQLFNLHFIKTGKIDVSHSRVLSRSQKDREEADYFSEYVFTMEDAKKNLKDIKGLIAAIEAILKKSGYLVV